MSNDPNEYLDDGDDGDYQDNPDYQAADFWDDYEAQFMETDELPEFFDLPECVMCGKERHTNSEGYCSTCWTVWNS